jgi:hypothetical protein
MGSMGCAQSASTGLEDAAAPAKDANAPTDAVTPDASAIDAGSDAGSADAADAGRVDAAEAGLDTGTFGMDCPTGTTYYESFDSDPAKDGGAWSLLAGSYSWSPGSVTLNAGSPNSQLWIGPRPNWTNYTVSTTITSGPANVNVGLNIRMEDSPSYPAPNDSGHMYFVGFNTTSTILGAESNGMWTSLASPPVTFTAGATHAVVVSVNGSLIKVSLDGTTCLNYTDSTFAVGSLGLRIFGSCTATYGPITVTCN